MCKRFTFFLLIAFIVSCLFAFPVFASADGVGGGFSLWNLLDGLGGFFRDLINSIGGFFVNLILAIRNIGNAILDAFGKVVKAIANGFTALLNGLKFLLIPSKESFSNFRDDILDAFDNKVGSVFSALDYLKSRFGSLQAKNDLYQSFRITFPKSSFLYGLSLDPLISSMSVFLFIRNCLTGLYCLITALILYNKVIAMVNK